jgi:hypothetical protein
LLLSLVLMAQSMIVWEFYKVNFDFSPKTSIHPFELFYHHKKPAKMLGLEGICFKGPN